MAETPVPFAKLTFDRTVYGLPSSSEHTFVPKVRLSFEHKDPRHSLGIKSRVPLEATDSKGNRYELKASIKNINPKIFMGLKKEGGKEIIKDTTFARLVLNLSNYLAQRETIEMFLATRDEIAISHSATPLNDSFTDEAVSQLFSWYEKAGKDKHLKVMPNKDSPGDPVKAAIKKDARERVMDWVKLLKPDSLRITEHTLCVPKENIVFRRIILGTKDTVETEANWHVGERIIETLLFAKKKFNAKMPEHLTVFSIATLENFQLINRLDPMFQSQFEEVTGIAGFTSHDQRYIVLLEPAVYKTSKIDRGRNGDIEVRGDRILLTQDVSDTAAHEISHIIEENFKENTTVPSEAFAIGMEYGFNFEELRKRFKTFRSSEKPIDKKTIVDIFNTPAYLQEFSPGRRLRIEEIYDIGPTLYGYLYEKLGPDILMRFHKLLTGREGEEYKHNFDLALLRLFDDSGETAGEKKEKLLDEYIIALNDKK